MRYKTAKEVPLNLRRKLFRLSALLELGDEEFSNLKKLTEKVERIYSRDVLKGKLDVDINLNSLAIYLDSTKEGTLFAELATKAGFTVREHKIDEKSIMLGKLFNLLYILNINKIAELDKILQDSLSWAQEALSTFFKIAKENNLKSYAISYTTIIFLLVIYANKNILDMEKLIALKLSNKALEIYKEIGIK